MQSVCHDTGDSSGYIEGSWIFRVQTFFFISLSIQTKTQNYFVLREGLIAPENCPIWGCGNNLFICRVLMAQVTLMHRPPWNSRAAGAGSGRHRAEFEGFPSAQGPGTAFWRSQLGSHCTGTTNRELTGFLKPFLIIDQRCGFNQTPSIIFLMWYEQILGKISGLHDDISLLLPWWVHFQNLELF